MKPVVVANKVKLIHHKNSETNRNVTVFGSFPLC